MLYAEVSVNSPAARRRLFSYSVPPGLRVEIGQAVWVPFGEKTLQGIVFSLGPTPSVEQTRDITGVIEEQPILSPQRLALARWISDYYLCPLFEAVSLMLPPGFLRRTLTFIKPSGQPLELSLLSPAQEQVMGLLQKEGRLEMSKLEKELGKKAAQAAVLGLVGRGLATRLYEVEPVRVKTKQELYIGLTDREQAQAVIQKGKPAKQAALLNYLSGQTGEVPAAEARKAAGCAAGTIKALIGKGLIQKKLLAVSRQVIDYRNIATSTPPGLSDTQRAALDQINKSLGDRKPAVFLLHGVTGSGKTEVYLGALAEAARLGKRGIVLVPEISLTPQTIARFAARFPGRVAVLHSGLSLGEQYDQWQGIRKGDYDVVIGARSAIFAPMADLGLIIIDEEHESSYKQESSPRYHARNVALKLAELAGAAVIMGSATPDVETFFRAGQGEFTLLGLPQRIAAKGGSLPQVAIVDLKEELKSGNTGIFSRSLKEAVNLTLGKGEQVILFYNRRGAAAVVQCRSCGRVLHCRRCDIPLYYHSGRDVLLCHRCGYHIDSPRSCPHCTNGRLRFLGMGTEKIEQEASIAFPGARILRWDSDAARGKGSHQKIMERFASHRADILIGTQMIAKGLDLPLVTLVGVVNADTGLSLPDFRAGERTFQLLCQVAGRAGRSELGGRVIIQSYCPQNYAIRAALGHDYASFYDKEILFRGELGYPPFCRLARLIYHHANNTSCRKETERMKRELLAERDRRGIAGIFISGPSPAFIQRLRGAYRWQLVLRGNDLPGFLAPVSLDRGWTIDVDPLGP